MNVLGTDLIFPDKNRLTVHICINEFYRFCELFESVAMGLGISYRDFFNFSSTMEHISEDDWQANFIEAIENELDNDKCDGFGHVATLLDILNQIIWLYESHKDEFDKMDLLNVEKRALKLAKEKRERLVIAASEAADVLKKAIEYELMSTLQFLSGHKKLDFEAIPSRLRMGANEHLDELVEQAEGMGNVINDLSKRISKGRHYRFADSIMTIIALRNRVESYRLFPIDELTAVENEKLYRTVNATDLIFPKKVCEIMCKVCNGILFHKIPNNAFIYGINHPVHPSPLKKLGEQNNRIFLIIYTLSKFLSPEQSKVWVNRMLGALDLKKKSYDSKATFCLGSSASTEDRELVQFLRKSFDEADVTIPW